MASVAVGGGIWSSRYRWKSNKAVCKSASTRPRERARAHCTRVHPPCVALPSAAAPLDGPHRTGRSLWSLLIRSMERIREHHTAHACAIQVR